MSEALRPIPPKVAAAIERFELACEGVFSRSGTTRPTKARAALVEAIQTVMSPGQDVAILAKELLATDDSDASIVAEMGQRLARRILEGRK